VDTSVHADLTVPDESVVLMDVGVLVEPVQLEGHVLALDTVSVTEIVLARNAEMTVVTLEISVTFAEPIKSVVVTSCVLEPVLPTAVILTEVKEYVETMVVSDHVESVLLSLDKISDAETVNVRVVLNVMSTLVDLMDVEEIADPVPVTANVSMELVCSLVWVAVVMVFAKLP